MDNLILYLLEIVAADVEVAVLDVAEAPNCTPTG
jgi:hypothetical protein